jgi:sulfatase maturation enzyme AslB (radical SAM superfamily)
MFQPKTSRILDEPSLSRLGDKIESVVRTRRELQKDAGYATPLPEEVGLQLTYRCNLRCDHCFQWNEDGSYHRLPILQQRDELDIDVIESVLRATSQNKAKLYLWGGEPLLYRFWERLAAILEADPRWTVLCTNGIGLERKLESLLRISSNLVILISLDGLEDANDLIRGKGAFAQITQSLDLLLRLKSQGAYRGEISISAVISSALVSRLGEFVQFCEARDVNTLYLVFPWYIPTLLAQRMDRFFQERFAWLLEQNSEFVSGRLASWHSYQFHVEPNLINRLKEELERLMCRTWKIRVRLQPALELHEVTDFILGSEVPAQHRTRCLSVRTRMNVLPNGGVTTCKLFPEFTIGRLTRDPDSVLNAWTSVNALHAREIFSCGLMPVCSKCVQLYL